jgi:hypothetical protein
MGDLDGCGLTVMVVGICLLVIATGFLFHIGWNLLDAM